MSSTTLLAFKHDDSLRFYRLLCVVGALIYSLVWVLSLWNPGVVDSLGQRLFLSSAALILVFISYKSYFVQRNFLFFCYGLAYLATFHLLYTALLNQFQFDYAMGFITGILILSLIFRTATALTLYLVFSIVSVSVVSILAPVHQIGAAVYINYVFTISVFVFLMLRSRMETENNLKKAKLQAEQANFSKSRFLANISHELRTPLTIVLGYAEMIKEEAQENDLPHLVEDVEEIESSTQHLITVINELLDLSKAEAGRVTFQYVHFALEDYIQQTIQSLGPLLKTNANQLKVTYEDLPEQIFLDPQKLHQILLNLLSNACKFTQGGTIQVHFRVEIQSGQECLRFEVADDGIGISADQQQLIFQPFVQAENQDTRLYGGTGLGLALCYRFCQLMGGSIVVESEASKGATFTCHLPLQEPEQYTNELYRSYDSLEVSAE